MTIIAKGLLLNTTKEKVNFVVGGNNIIKKRTKTKAIMDNIMIKKRTKSKASQTTS
jgi:hypothetical protein